MYACMYVCMHVICFQANCPKPPDHEKITVFKNSYYFILLLHRSDNQYSEKYLHF